MMIEVDKTGEIRLTGFHGTAEVLFADDRGVSIAIEEDDDDWSDDDVVILTPLAVSLENVARELLGERGAW